VVICQSGELSKWWIVKVVNCQSSEWKNEVIKANLGKMTTHQNQGYSTSLGWIMGKQGEGYAGGQIIVNNL
jgi:hypothetical protein